MLLGILLLLAIAVIFWNFFWKRRALPPGPAPLPLLGNLLEIEKLAAQDGVGYCAFEQFAREYGPVYTVWMGEDPYVMVTDLELIRDVFIGQGDATSGRYFFAVGQILSTNHGHQRSFGVSRTNGNEWRFLRRTTLNMLRDIGMGRTQMGHKLLLEMRKMSAKIRAEKANGTVAHNMTPLIDELNGSALSLLLFGHPLKQDGLEQFHRVKQDLRQFLTLVPWKTVQMWSSTWWLRHIPPFRASFQLVERLASAIFAELDAAIGQKMEARGRGKNGGGGGGAEFGRKSERMGEEDEDEGVEEDGQEEPADFCFVDAFLEEIEECERERAEGAKKAVAPLEQSKYFHIESLRNICWDLFLAGNESTGNILQFMCIYLANDQTAQERLHSELAEFARKNALLPSGDCDDGDRLDGLCSAIAIEHRPKLVYANAVVNEAMRLVNLVPFNFARKATRDLEVGGHKVEKGTVLVAQVANVMCDEKVYPEPNLFKPERYIDGIGRLKKAEELMPFGMGKRQCAGEGLARQLLFLFTANFFLAYRVLPPDHPVSTAKLAGLLIYPVEEKIRLRVEPHMELLAE